MAEEARRKRCEVLFDLEKVLSELSMEAEYYPPAPTYDPEKAAFLEVFRKVIDELLEMCRIECVVI